MRLGLLLLLLRGNRETPCSNPGMSHGPTAGYLDATADGS